jgi:hypothetical protein
MWHVTRLYSPLSVSLMLAIVILSGCGHAEPAVHMPGWALDAARPERPRPRRGTRGRSESSDFVVAALQSAGLHFGTDGTVASLWQYLRTSHRPVEATTARPGDVLLFRVAPVPDPGADACDAPDGAGIVSAVDGTGRIGFVEARNGRKMLSYVDPKHPRVRRDAEGQLRNSFLRTPRPSDPLGTPLLAGQMLCAVARPSG